MNGLIFISYRREESRWSARSLRDRLSRDFDPTQIFMDIDTIGLGEDFGRAIETTVAKCDVLIAVIGDRWLTAKDDHGARRLDNPDDWVRMEIGAALKRDIRVIPVLVDGASMPRPTDLPEDLRPLVRRNALQITDTSFAGDCQRLSVTIREVLARVAAEQASRAEEERKQDRVKQVRTASKSVTGSEHKPKQSVSKPRGWREPLFAIGIFGFLSIVATINGLTEPQKPIWLMVAALTGGVCILTVIVLVLRR